MRRYLVRRLLQIVPLLLGISIVVFLVIQAAPGGPEASLLGAGKFVDPEVIESYRRRLGVDQPITVQYFRWLGAALQGDLGVSFSTSRPVLAVIAERLPATLELMGVGFLLAAALAIPLGLYGALRPGSGGDVVGTGAAFLGLAMPVFWFGLILQLVFSVRLGWLPVAGTGTVGATSLGDHLLHLILPSVVLSTRYLAGWSRYFRSSLLASWRADFVRTARAKGLRDRAVLAGHVVRTALIPLVSVMALNAAELVSGAVITETVFAWPGIGRLFVQAMFARDYPVLMGVLLMGAAAVIVVNLLADVGYALLDPRIRYD
jgi:peptide/nickel transport system permease protein